MKKILYRIVFSNKKISFRGSSKFLVFFFFSMAETATEQVYGSYSDALKFPLRWKTCLRERIACDFSPKAENNFRREQECQKHKLLSLPLAASPYPNSFPFLGAQQGTWKSRYKVFMSSALLLYTSTYTSRYSSHSVLTLNLNLTRIQNLGFMGLPWNFNKLSTLEWPFRWVVFSGRIISFLKVAFCYLLYKFYSSYVLF